MKNFNDVEGRNDPFLQKTNGPSPDPKSLTAIVRTSTSRQLDRYSPETQQTEILSYAKRQGINLKMVPVIISSRTHLKRIKKVTITSKAKNKEE